MRQLSWALIGMAGLIVIGLQTAEAGMTCRVVRGWCPDKDFNATHSDKTASSNTDADHSEHGPTSVPEPATLMLLGAGVSAVGAAALRRRKQK